MKGLFCLNVILNLEVEVDASSVASFHYHEGLNFPVSEVRFHCHNVERELQTKLMKENDKMKVK